MEGARATVCFGMALPVESLGFGREGGDTRFCGPAKASGRMHRGDRHPGRRLQRECSFSREVGRWSASIRVGRMTGPQGGSRNGGFSSILLKVREQLGIVTEAGSPTCLLCQTERPLSWRSRPEGARLVGPAGTKGWPVRRHCPGGPTSRRPQRGSGLPRPGSFAFGRYRNGRRSSRRAQCWRWWDCVRKETPLALRARGMSSSMRRLCPGCSRGMPLI